MRAVWPVGRRRSMRPSAFNVHDPRRALSGSALEQRQAPHPQRRTTIQQGGVSWKLPYSWRLIRNSRDQMTGLTFLRGRRIPWFRRGCPGSRKEDSTGARVYRRRGRSLHEKHDRNGCTGRPSRDRLRPGWRRFPPWLDKSSILQREDSAAHGAQARGIRRDCKGRQHRFAARVLHGHRCEVPRREGRVPGEHLQAGQPSSRGQGYDIWGEAVQSKLAELMK